MSIFRLRCIVLTTKDKKVDASKSERDLGHTNSYSLEDGIKLTAEWMHSVYNIS